MDWQAEVKTSPSRLQSSSLVQSCQGDKRQLQSTNILGKIRRTKPRTNLYFHYSVGHIQVPQTGDRGSSSLLTKAESISHYGDGLWLAVLGLNELHLLARIRSCTDGGLNFAIVFKTVQPVKAQHETRCGHLPADTHQPPHAHKKVHNVCVLPSRYLECELHELRYKTRVSLLSHKIKERQHKLVARLVRQEVGARLGATRTMEVWV